MSSLQTTENLRRQLASRENEIKYINSNFWLLALKEIQGLSGYICRRCKQLGFTPVRNLGYDMTMLARHKCDETKVKSIKMCSIRKSDRFSVENFIASRMLDFLKLCMPGQKYIFSQDISNTFNSIENIYGLEIAKKMYGIADRIYYYSVDKSEKKDWLKRVLKKLGARTRVEEFEIKDFLMMIKSTYGIIDVLDGEARKRIIITLVS